MLRLKNHSLLLGYSLKAIVMGVNEKINTITNRQIISEECTATLKRVLAINNTLLQEAKDEIVMVCACLDLSKLLQLPEMHILQSDL